MSPSLNSLQNKNFMFFVSNCVHVHTHIHFRCTRAVQPAAYHFRATFSAEMKLTCGASSSSPQQCAPKVSVKFISTFSFAAEMKLTCGASSLLALNQFISLTLSNFHLLQVIPEDLCPVVGTSILMFARHTNVIISK